MSSKPIYFETQTMSLCCIVGIYLDNGQVCEFTNFDSKGKVYESGDIVELPRKGMQKLSAVVILGIHEDLGPAIVAAKVYFDRICKWDDVTDRSNLKVFGHDIIALEEQVSQIGLFDTQGMSGPQLLTTNCIDLKVLLDNDDESPQESQE